VYSRLVVMSCLFFLCACGGGSSSDALQDGIDSEVAEEGVSISGTVRAVGSTDIDEDTGTSDAFVISPENNSISTAQVIANPISLGGYLSDTSGNFSDGVRFEADDTDVFAVPILEGQTLTLSVYYADDQFFTQGKFIDIDFRLLKRTSGTDPLLYAVVQEENIRSPGAYTYFVDADGEYYIELKSDSGFTFAHAPAIYNVSLSDTVQLSEVQTVSLPAYKADIVPNEYVFIPQNMSLNRRRAGETFSSGSAEAERANTRSFSSAALSEQGFIRQNDRDRKLHHYVKPHNFATSASRSNSLDRLDTIREIARLRGIFGSESIEPVFIYHAASVNDPALPSQWGLPMIGAPSIWDTATGAGQSIAIIDTGVDLDHEDLAANVDSSLGYDFVSSTANSGDGNGRDSDASEPFGTTYHGSHVAGIAAAVANNSKGVAGVAYDATIIPIRALGSDGSGTSVDIADAILYAAGLLSAGGQTLSAPADVINLSLGSNQESLAIRSAVQDAYNAGSIVIAAAGNDGSSSNFYPASQFEAIGVGSVNEAEQRSLFSNIANNVDLMAPGGTDSRSGLADGVLDGIYSTVGDDNYTEYKGTSMAAPFVSGIAALMKQANPAITPEIFQEYVRSGLITRPAGPQQEYGQGIVSAVKAIDVAGGDVPASLLIFPRELSFIGANDSATLSLSNPQELTVDGDGDIVITSIVSEASWLEITDNAALNGLGDYALKVNPNLLPDDLARTEIVIQHTKEGVAQDQERVSILVSGQQIGLGLGDIQVYLLRFEDILAQEGSGSISLFELKTIEPSNGVYSFRFDDVAPGKYVLEASTDIDGDSFVFDFGEAIGAYPLVSDIGVLEVSSEAVSGLNFEIGYIDLLTGFTASDLGAEQITKARKIPTN